MTEEEKGLAISAEVAKELTRLVYNDVVHPVLARVGFALEAVLARLLLPYLRRAAPDMIETEILRSNVHEFSRHLDIVDDRNLQKAHIELAAPLLQRLTYVTSEEILNLYLEALVRACDKSSDPPAHPSFIRVIDGLSADEARMIPHFLKSQDIPFMYLRMVFEDEGKWMAYTKLLVRPTEAVRALSAQGIDRPIELTNLGYEVAFDLPEKVTFYLNNLAAPGIIIKKMGSLSDFKRWYAPIESANAEARDSFYREGHKGKTYPVVFIPGYYSLTQFGFEFASCVLVRT